MHNKQVFYTHFPFCLLCLHNKQAMYISRNNEVHLCNNCTVEEQYVLYIPKVCVCSLRYPA